MPQEPILAELKNLSVSFLSLVGKPATGKSVTLKFAQKGERTETFAISKMDGEKMIAYGVVYAPNQEDSHGDFASADTIRAAAYEFMREGRLKNIDAEHSFTAEMAYVAESWLVRKGDALFPDEPEGAWAVGIRVGDPDLWGQLKSGELTGISLAGIAHVEPDEDDPRRPEFVGKDEKGILHYLKTLVTASEKEPEMNDDDVRKIVRSEVGPAVTDALKEAGLIKEADPKAEMAEIAAKTVATALKEAGFDPKAKAKTEDDPPATEEGGGSEETATLKSLLADHLKSVDAKIAVALAKGETESGGGGGKQ